MEIKPSTKNNEEILTYLLDYVRAEGRICPMPLEWNALWDMLPDKRRIGNGWDPQLPLILAAWWDASPMAKRIVLEEHIQYAAEHNALDLVDDFLRNLRPDQWFTVA